MNIKRLIKGKKYNFTIQLNSITEYDEQTKYDLSALGLTLSNYLIKFSKEEKAYNLESIIDKDITFKKVYYPLESDYHYYFTIKNNNKNPITLNDNFTCNYLFKFYPKKEFNESQLNTTAYTDIVYYLIFQYNYKTDDPNEEFSFYSYFLEDNVKYYLYLFVKLNNNENNEEQYFSKLYEINTTIDDKNNKKNAIIFGILFGSIFIITIVISIIICARFRRKNKDLKKQIEEISLVNKNDRKDSQQSEEITFI